MAHTPGPWMIYEGGMIGSAAVRRFPDMTVIHPGTVKGETIGVAMANARLIAAAPALLAVVERLADQPTTPAMFFDQPELVKLIEDARAAIKAAKGE